MPNGSFSFAGSVKIWYWYHQFLLSNQQRSKQWI